ncbi:MAG: hypothetical protein PVF58_20440 [Candidatus Methanofastidiosia archaeon]|jgi:hypothetical protein
MYQNVYAKDIIRGLENAMKENQPIYVSEGLCGLCDVLHKECKKVTDPKKLLEKLKKLDKNSPVNCSDLYELCGTCDYIVKK